MIKYHINLVSVGNKIFSTIIILGFLSLISTYMILAILSKVYNFYLFFLFIVFIFFLIVLKITFFQVIEIEDEKLIYKGIYKRIFNLNNIEKLEIHENGGISIPCLITIKTKNKKKYKITGYQYLFNREKSKIKTLSIINELKNYIYNIQ